MGNILARKPANYRDLLKSSVKVYKASFKRVIFISIILGFLAFIPRLLAIVIGQDLFLNLSPLDPNRLWLVVINLGVILLYIGLLWRTHCVTHGLSDSYRTDLRIGFRKTISVFLAGIIQGAIVFAFALVIYGLQILLHNYQLMFENNLGSLLLTFAVFGIQLVLIVYLSTLFFFFIPLIAIENYTIVQALERSVILGWNHWWRIFSLQLTPWLIYYLVLVVIKYCFHVDVHMYFFGNNPHDIETTIINLIVFIFFIPWSASILLVQLNDLELRHKPQEVHKAPKRPKPKSSKKK